MDENDRHPYTKATLDKVNKTPNTMENVLKRLVNKQEYGVGTRATSSNAVEEVLDRANRIIASEGIQIEVKGYKETDICIRKIKSLSRRTENKKVSWETLNFTKITSDPDLADILNERWSEVDIDIQNGAYLSAVVMMGSILEGILLAMAESNKSQAEQTNATPSYKDKNGLRQNPKPFKDWGLNDFIDVGLELGWIKRHTQQFSHTLREYRNLIHPHQQKLKKEHPDKDTADICLVVVKAAINDLIVYCSVQSKQV